MKFSVLSSALFLIGSASAFTPLQTDRSASVQTRGEFFGQVAGIVGVVATFPEVASAAKYGSIGSDSPGVLDPSEAILDDEVFATAAVQDALKQVKGYSALVTEMKSALASNDQVNLGPTIRKQFDFSKLRADMNTLNSAFDEDTQRGTDRLIRVILQDLTELEAANNQKEGIERSPRRVANMNAKLDKLQKTFDDLLAFTS